MPEMNIVNALNLALDQEMAKNEKVLILGEDVGKDGGVFRVTDKLIDKYGEERVISTPLAEAAIVGCAEGLAIGGMRPIVEIQFSGFIYPAFQEIISHLSRFRTRSRGKFTCPLVIRTPYAGGIRALEHHSESMEALFAHIPGLKVVVPSTPYDAKGLLVSAIRDDDPVLFLEPKSIYRAIKQEVPNEEYVIPIGKANVVKEGNDVTLIAWGAMVRVAQEAADSLKYSCEIIDLRSISPLDTETVINSIKKTGRCVIVHEAPRSFGVGAEIIARINEKALLSLEAPVQRVTGYDVIYPLFKLEKEYLPNANKVIKAIETVMRY